jgi:hypothetical protein
MPPRKGLAKIVGDLSRGAAMSTSQKDAGTIQALLERLNKQRLPRALELKKRVDAGGKLEDGDIDFLHRVFKDANDVQGVIAKYPEYQTLVAQLISLYSEITRKALENEENS